MKTTTTRPRLPLALIAAATIIGASACGTTGTGAGSSAAPPTATKSSSAPLESTMGASMEPTTGASTGSTTGSTMAAAAGTIHIKSFAYTGPDNVPAGAAVAVMNMDSEAHTVTADDGSFDAIVKAGTSTTFTAPAKPGTYTYHCAYHSNMHGTLTVK